jgi:hypothetical protein
MIVYQLELKSKFRLMCEGGLITHQAPLPVLLQTKALQA